MKRALLAAAILALPLLLSGAAQAQPVSGLYIGAGGGANFLESQRIRTTTLGGVTTPVASSNHISFDTGYAGLGSVGYGFGNGVRVEVEGNYRYNRISAITAPPGGVSAGGNEQKYGAMGNVLFDMDIGSPYVWPYLGAGAGWQAARQTQKSTVADGATQDLSGTKGAFAYQAIVGAAFPIPWVVGLSATTEFRYIGLNGNRSYSGTQVAGGVATQAARQITQNNNFDLLLGLRYAFYVPPPPPPPASVPVAAPAPAAARSYLVFFDWDRADLTARARQIVAEAAQNSTRVQYTRIEVNGYTDRSGNSAYNQRLSVRRAEAVAAELVKDGVPRTAIDIHGFGESHPLVPTAAGVREPQNRRVEIVLQ